MMIREMKNYGWLFLIRGIVTLLFGVFTLMNPGLTAVTLVLAFGSYALVSGLIALSFGLFNRAAANHRSMLVVQGALHAILGALVLAWPGITAISLLAAIIAYAFISGVVEIVMAVQTRNFWLGLSGVASAAFGIYAFRFPGDGALAVLLLIGVYAISAGIMLIIGGFQVRRLGGKLTTHAAA